MKRLMMVLMIVALLGMSLSPTLAQTDDTNPGSAAALVPDSAEFYAWLNVADMVTNLDHVLSLSSRFDDTMGMEGISGELLLEYLLSDLFQGAPISYSLDIQPWLGNEAGFAVGNFTALMEMDMGMAPDAEFVIVIESQSRSDTLAVLDRLLLASKQAGEPFSESVYQDETVYLSAQEDAAIAIPGDYLVIGTPRMVRDVIDVSVGEAPSLADSDAFGKVMIGVPAGSAGGFYIDQSIFTSVMALALEGAGQSADALPPEMLEDTMQALSIIESMALSIRIDASAIMLDVAMAYDETAMTDTYGLNLHSFMDGEFSGRIFQALPSDTFALVAGRDLPQRYEAFQAQLATLEPLAAQIDQLLVSGEDYQGPALADMLRIVERWPVWFERLFDVSVEDDFLASIEAEYAVALVPMSPHALEGKTSRFPFDLLAVAEITNPELAADTVERFTAATQDLGFSSLMQSVGDVPMYSVRLAQHPRAYVSLALTDSFGAIGNGVWSITQFLEMAASGQGSLLDNPRLTAAMDYLGAGKHTVMFIDMEGVQFWLDVLPEGPIEPAFDVPLGEQIEELTEAVEMTTQDREGIQALIDLLDSFTVSCYAAGPDVFSVTYLAVLSE